MEVVRPTTVTDTMLLQSSIPEPDATKGEAVWNAMIAYEPGDRRIRVETHRVYEALDYTTGDTPESNPDIWADAGPTNRWGMFDNVLSTRSVDDGAYFATLPAWNIATPYLVGDEVKTTTPDRAFEALQPTTGDNPTTNPEIWRELGKNQIIVRVQQDWFDTVALFNVFGDGFVELKVFGPDGVTQIGDTRTQEMEISKNITNMWLYLTEPFTFLSEMLFRGLPIGYRNIVQLRIVSSSLSAEVGEVVIGIAQSLGSTEIGLQIGIEDFSRKEVDDFGNAKLVRRRFAKLVNAVCELPNPQLNAVVGTLFDLRAKPVVWIPTEMPEYSITIVYGFYRDFYVTIAYHTHSLCQLEIEGIT